MTWLGMGWETRRNAGFAPTPGLMIRLKSLVAGKRAVRQLHQLDDRLLADIGLARGEIDASVWGRRR